MSIEFKSCDVMLDGSVIRQLDITNEIFVQVEEDNSGHFKAKLIGTQDFISHSSEDTERMVLDFLHKVYELVKESK